MDRGELPSPDDFEGAAIGLERLRDSLQSSLKQDDRHEDEVARAALRSQRRIAHLGPLSASIGDTLRGYDNKMRYLMGNEEERYAREMKTRTVSDPLVYVDAGWGSEADATATSFKRESDQAFGDAKLESSQKAGSMKLRTDMLFGLAMQESSRNYEEDEAIKRDRARAMAVPGDPTGFVDNLSTIRILELWRGKPMSELDDAVRNLTDKDPYAKAALGNVVELRTNAQRAEQRRIINSEWRMDMSYGDHDFALPQAAGAKRPGLDATQAKLVDVLTAIASKSVLSGRYLSSDSKNTIFGANPQEAFGGLLDASTSTTKLPSAARTLFSSANWALGIHGDRKSMMERIQAVVGAKDETWAGDQVNFFGSWLMPSTRDVMGEHRTPVDIELAPLRTMMGLRSNLGLAPKTTPVIAADGQVALVGVLDDSDPLYQRELFIPNWGAIRPRYVYEAAMASGVEPDMEVGSTYMNPRVAGGSYFNPYNDRIERFRTDGIIQADKKTKEAELRSTHEIELDHIVALKYAWEHGFRDMYLGALGNPARMARVLRFMTDYGQGVGPFANNFALAAKDQNQAKSDKGPDQWAAHGIALDAHQHAGNMFHIQKHLQVIGALRARQAAMDGGLNPDFMPTSVSEERAIQRVLRGWDIGSNNVYGRARDEALKFWMETMVVPDLSEDPYYLQARGSALMTYMTMAKYSATWRLNPYNQAYLLGRKYLSPVFRRAWDKMTGESAKQWPSQFSELRSTRLDRKDLTSFMREWSSQGTQREMTSMVTGEVVTRERRIVAPTFSESFRYARGHANPFSVPDLPATPSAGSLRATFDDFRLDHIVSYLHSDQGRVFGEAVFRSFAPSTSGTLRASSFDQAYQAIVPGPLRARLEREAMDAYRNLHVQEQIIRRGRAPLDASPMLTDIWRSLTDRSDGAGFGRRVTRAVGNIFNDFGIKTLDYGLRAQLSGAPVLQTLADRFISSPTIIGIETISSYVSTLTKQETYVSPIMGKRSLLGHDPFALLRGVNAENLRLTLRSFQPYGGLARLEAMRAADRAAAAAAASAVRRAKVAQARALAALPRSSVSATERLLTTLAENHAQSAGGARYYARVSGAKAIQLPSDLHQTDYDLIWSIQDARALHPSASDLALNDFLSSARIAYPQGSRFDLIERLSDQGDVFLDRHTGTKRIAYRHPGNMRVNGSWNIEGDPDFSPVPTRYGRRPSTVDFSLKPISDLPPNFVTAATQAEWEAINPSLHGLNTFSVADNFDPFQNYASRQSLANRLNRYNQAAQEVADSRKAHGAALRRIKSAWGPGQLPPTLEQALGSTGLQRMIFDIQLSNPHATMFAGRLRNAPMSIVKGFGCVGMAFTVDALENLTIKRSSLTGGKRFASRVFRYGGYGLSAFGAVENIKRFEYATDLLADAGGFSGLSQEQKTDVLTYAHRSPGTVLLDEGLSALTADPIGLFAAGMNRYGSAFVRGELYRDATYQSELIGGILRDDVPIADKYRHRADVKRMNDAGIYPGEGSDMMVGSTRDAYRMRAAVTHAAMIQVYRRVNDSRNTAKQATAAKKALNKGIQAARWMASLGTMDDDVSSAAKQMMANLRESEPRIPRSSASMPIFTSVAYRPGQNLESFSRDDSLRLRRIVSTDASRVDHDAMADKRARGMMERIAGDARVLLDPPAAGRDASFGGFLARYQNRSAGRELVDQARSSQRDSLVRAGGRPAPLDPFETEPQSFLPKNTFKNLFALDSLERADLEKDRLQAAQRRPRK